MSHHHGHGHGHAHAHAHGHAGGSGAAESAGAPSDRRLLIALAILGSFTLIEAAGGYIANSLALLAEAAHMLADSASLLLAVVAIRVARRPASPRRSYGHRRYLPLAAFVNGLLLFVLTAWVIYEAILRLMQRPAVDGRIMLIVAVLGGIANLAAFLALSGSRSLNERSARAHILSDLLGSIAASIAALLILERGWTIADPILSLLVSLLILRSAWSLTRESADVLLESAPPRFDVARIEDVLLGHVPGLIGVHHVHVWTMTGERPTVTLHAHLAPGTAHYAALGTIHARLVEYLHVEHCTVQIEEGDCPTPDCGPGSTRG